LVLRFFFFSGGVPSVFFGARRTKHKHKYITLENTNTNT
jgi:hypothetical protein